MDQLALKCAGALTLIFVATGETIVVLRGGIDLSVGGILSLATAIAVTRADASFVELIPWLLLILAIGALVGMLNGVIISVLGLQPFLVTLATWSIVEGVALTVLPCRGRHGAAGLVRGRLLERARRADLGVPAPCRSSRWWAWFSRTRLASRIRAAGSNERSAFLNRVSLMGTNVAAYGLSGLFAALAGWFYVTQTGAGSPTWSGPSTCCRRSPPW